MIYIVLRAFLYSYFVIIKMILFFDKTIVEYMKWRELLMSNFVFIRNKNTIDILQY